MANWDAIVNNRVMMGRSRSLYLALNAARRRREAEEDERRPGVIPFLGRGIVPIVQDLISGKGSQGEITKILIWQEGEAGPLQ